MADINYTLFGQEFYESQGKMMARVFETLLTRHPEIIPEALGQFPCLSSIDYSEDPESLREASSDFRTKRSFQVEGKTLCVGTSHNFERKKALVKRLFQLCDEDPGQLRIEPLKEGSPALSTKTTSTQTRKQKIGLGKMQYELFGERYVSTQAEMMYRVFEQIMARKPELAEWAAEHLDCVSRTDFTRPENRGTGMKANFSSCRMLQIGCRTICIGSSYNLKDKQRRIDRLRQQAGFPPEVFRILSASANTRLLELRPWQKDAIETILKALYAFEVIDGRLGLVSIPTGVGKSQLLVFLLQRFFQVQGIDQSVILLSSRAQIVEQYANLLMEQSENGLETQIAASIKDFVERAGTPGLVLLSTAQKVLEKNRGRSADRSQVPPAPFSLSSHLLVVVEDADYHYFGRIYDDMRARFPNAVFLGFTSNPEPSPKLQRTFGPVIYRYTLHQAYRDGLLSSVDYQYIEGSFEDKIENITQCMKSKGAKAFGCLFCASVQEAYTFYEALCTSAEQVTLAVSTVIYSDRFRTGTNLPRDAYWDGKTLHGLVITCNLMIGGPAFDVIFLNRKETNAFRFYSILGQLARITHKRAENGLLVDFENGPDRVLRLIPDGFPLRVLSSKGLPLSPESPRLKLHHLSRLLSQRQFDNAKELLDEMQTEFPSVGKRLYEQLSFLFEPSQTREQQRRFWEQHRSMLEWKCALWCLLSRDSTCAWETQHETEPAEQLESEKEPERREPPRSDESPPARGKRLEQATRQMIQRLFELDETASAQVLENLRVQTSGNQYGFDVTFTYIDRFEVKTTCMIECKNYRNDPIRLQDVAPKLAALQATGKKVDHWILIAPNSQVSNEIWEIAENWSNAFFWEPIRDVQFWTEDNNVRELFGLFPDIYAQFYSGQPDNPPERWDEERKSTVLKRWKEKLAPVPLLPTVWRKYLKDPVWLLMQSESDLKTQKEYERLYAQFIPLRLLDAEEFPVDGTAEAYIFTKWLPKEDSSSILLLGDFGDGKTFFTYTLARILAKKFLQCPSKGWIPLRLPLSDLRDGCLDCRDFLKRRLEEFQADLGSWNELQGRYQFLIILDGLDEMSLKMSDTAVLDNLGRLEDLVAQFKGHKLLVTSRKMAVFADRVRDRILSILDGPECLHLAPIALGDRLDYLNKQADTPQKRKRLLKMQSTHDLLGLAAKPLFLEMERALLEEGYMGPLDAAGIYEAYAEKALNRKFRQQLLRNNYTQPKRVIQNLLALLEDLALCLQRKGVDSISLELFKQEIGRGDLAEKLWDISCDTEEEEDAEGRISVRSLLKYDGKDPEKRCFCHRSMKEYFVARGLVRQLCEAPEEGRRLLMECGFGCEILEFAGHAIQRMRAQKAVFSCLASFAQESRGKCKDPLREHYARLSENSVNLLYYSGQSLPGDNWSGLLLDNVILSGMNLAGKNFSNSSMRFVHLDNADLTGCDLRGCDFTGVQFERAGQLVSFAMAPHDGALYASYKDGAIRRWQIVDGRFKTLVNLSSEKWGQIFILPNGREGHFRADYLWFWNQRETSLSLSGGFPLRGRLRILDIGTEAILLWSRGMLYFIDLSTHAVRFQQEAPEDLRACILTVQAFFVCSAERGLTLIDLSKGDPVYADLLEERSVSALCATPVTDTEAQLFVGRKDGSLQSYRVNWVSERTCWEFIPEAYLHNSDAYVLGVGTDCAGGLYSSTPNGTITRYLKNDLGELEPVYVYKLELKCQGTQIEGVHPKEQYDILNQARAE